MGRVTWILIPYMNTVVIKRIGFFAAVALVGVFTVLIGNVGAATTISTNVSTDGNVSATGTLQVTGTVTFYGDTKIGPDYGIDTRTVGTLNIGTTTASRIIIGSPTGSTTIMGVLTLQPGYSLDARTVGTLNIGTTTASRVIIGSPTASTTIGGVLSVPAGYSLDVTSAGRLNIGTTTANSIWIGKAGVTTEIYGTASSSAAKIGGGTTIAGVVFGYCNIASVTITATSTGYAVCSGATGVAASDRVWVMATSSMPAGMIVEAASSTAADTISLRINNANTGANTATGAISLNFWAAR